MTARCQLDLLPRQFPLRWHDDETLFSMCSRYHRISGARNSGHTGQRLFGSRRAGVRTDFPTHLATFVERTGGELGSAEEILTYHTVFPYYAVFAKSEYVGEIRRLAIEGGSLREVKTRLGTLSGGSARQPLKYCQACNEEEHRKYGTSFWRCADQLPTSLVCFRHNTWLSNNLPKGQQVEWCLPHDEGASEPIPERPAGPMAEAISLAGHSLLAFGRTRSFDIEHVAKTYAGELQDSGLIPASNSITHACERFQAFADSAADDAPAFRWACRGHAWTFIRRLVNGPHFTDPVRHLLFILWLFGSFDRFVSRYNATSPLQKAFVWRQLDLPVATIRFAG